jgi:hypothetical protein
MYKVYWYLANIFLFNQMMHNESVIILEIDEHFVRFKTHADDVLFTCTKEIYEKCKELIELVAEATVEPSEAEMNAMYDAYNNVPDLSLGQDDDLPF